jgi:23S rRNA (adenine2030-N6)-methyltransferase
MAGVGRFAQALPTDHPYLRALSQTRLEHGSEAYPGSPMVAAQLLRPDDPMHLAELHPQESAALETALTPRAKIYKEDGFEMAHKVAPPTPRRGLMLIDPPYEVKSDYEKIPTQISKLHRKWNVGVIALWYPILKTGPHTPMLGKLESLKLPAAFRHELRFPPAREGHKMVGSGMFIINAPFGLADAADALGTVFDTAAEPAKP